MAKQLPEITEEAEENWQEHKKGQALEKSET